MTQKREMLNNCFDHQIYALMSGTRVFMCCDVNFDSRMESQHPDSPSCAHEFLENDIPDLFWWWYVRFGRWYLELKNNANNYNQFGLIPIFFKLLGGGLVASSVCVWLTGVRAWSCWAIGRAREPNSQIPNHCSTLLVPAKVHMPSWLVPTLTLPTIHFLRAVEGQGLMKLSLLLRN